MTANVLVLGEPSAFESGEHDHNRGSHKFAVRQIKPDEKEVPGIARLHVTPHVEQAIGRVKDGADGYLVNEGPSTVRLSYRLVGDSQHSVGSDEHLVQFSRQVGPTMDYIAPGQAKEIGAGPGVFWCLVAV